MTTDPTSEAELFDMLTNLFGVGDWDDTDPLPYWKFRLKEIAKLKNQLRTRGTSISQLATTARYCWERKLVITYPGQLFPYVPEAMRAAKAGRVTDIARDIEDAIRRERTSPGPDSELWINRLVRANGDYRKEVLAEWRKARSLA